MAPRKKSCSGERSPAPAKTKAEGCSPGEAVSTTLSAPAPATPQEACRRAVDAIIAAFPAIIQAQIEKAAEGSHQDAKFLCEFAGLSGALVSPAAAPEDSLARLLLDKLEVGNEDSEALSGEPSSVP